MSQRELFSSERDAWYHYCQIALDCRNKAASMIEAGDPGEAKQWLQAAESATRSAAVIRPIETTSS